MSQILLPKLEEKLIGMIDAEDNYATLKQRTFLHLFFHPYDMFHVIYRGRVTKIEPTQRGLAQAIIFSMTLSAMIIYALIGSSLTFLGMFLESGIARAAGTGICLTAMGLAYPALFRRE